MTDSELIHAVRVGLYAAAFRSPPKAREGHRALVALEARLALLTGLTEAIEKSRVAEEVMLEEWRVQRRVWQNNPVMETLKEGILALRRIRYVIDPPPKKEEASAA